jgi:hypothetical protein
MTVSSDPSGDRRSTDGRETGPALPPRVTPSREDRTGGARGLDDSTSSGGSANAGEPTPTAAASPSGPLGPPEPATPVPSEALPDERAEFYRTVFLRSLRSVTPDAGEHARTAPGERDEVQ